MIWPVAPNLNNITFEQSERLSYRVTQFVVGRMKHFPFLHLGTLASNNVIPLKVFQKINNLFFQFEVNFYLKMSELLYQAFRANKAGINFSILSEENMKEILTLMSEYNLIVIPLANPDTWTIQVEFKTKENAFNLSEFSHGRLDNEKTLPYNEAISPL